MGEKRPIIVVAAYSRHRELSDLLDSVVIAKNKAKQPWHVLVSIDGENDEVTKVARRFEKHAFEVRTFNRRLGLKDHILRCGDLTKDYAAVVMLEDDLLLSPAALEFVEGVLPDVRAQPGVCSLSLYNFQFSDAAEYPTLRTEGTGDIFYARTGSSWGQVWWDEKWQDFRLWLREEYRPKGTYNVPTRIAKWPETSWKKLFNFWMAERGYYTAAPYSSLALCTGGRSGTNVSGTVGVWFSRVRATSRQLCIEPISDALRLDEFLEIEMADSSERVADGRVALEEIDFDLLCTKGKSNIRRPFVFTRRVQAKSGTLATYDVMIGNPVLALLLDRKGEGLYLVRSEDFDDSSPASVDGEDIRLYFPWLSTAAILRLSLRSIWRGLIRWLRGR